MENNKSNKGLIIFLSILSCILVTIIVLLLTGVIGSSEDNNPVEKDDTKKEEKVTKEYIILNESEKYHKVPYINIDSEDAKIMNDEIVKLANLIDKDCISKGYCSITYQDILVNNKLSVLVNASNTTNNYYTANIDVKTGKKITNEDLIKEKNLSEADLKTLLFNVYEDLIKNELNTYKSTNAVGKEVSMYDATKEEINSTNLDDFKMFIDENNNLYVAITYYVYAGAGYTTRFVDIENKEFYIIDYSTFKVAGEK